MKRMFFALLVLPRSEKVVCKAVPAPLARTRFASPPSKINAFDAVIHMQESPPPKRF